MNRIKPSILFISFDYPPALEYFYDKFLDIKNKSYAEQKALLANNMVRIADLLAFNLAKLGYKTESIVANNEFLQKKWAEENRVSISSFSPPHLARRSYLVRSLIARFPRLYYLLKDLLDKKSWLPQILLAQIRHFQPEVLHLLDLHYFSPNFIKQMKSEGRFIIGQISSPLFLPLSHLKLYDFLLSSYPHYVEEFRKQGIKTAYFPHAFEPEILRAIDRGERKYNCVFIGGLNYDQKEFSVLEELAEKVDINFWGYSQPPLPLTSPVLKKYQGQAWGIDMYRILAQSKIVVNRHIKAVAKNYANNMRLYEATGMGALLITDMKDNLREIFEIGKEVETYNSFEELVEKIDYYSKHNDEREKIAKAGQERTLRDHTYEVRAKELVKILENYL